LTTHPAAPPKRSIADRCRASSTPIAFARCAFARCAFARCAFARCAFTLCIVALCIVASNPISSADEPTGDSWQLHWRTSHLVQSPTSEDQRLADSEPKQDDPSLRDSVASREATPVHADPIEASPDPSSNPLRRSKAGRVVRTTQGDVPSRGHGTTRRKGNVGQGAARPVRGETNHASPSSADEEESYRLREVVIPVDFESTDAIAQDRPLPPPPTPRPRSTEDVIPEPEAAADDAAMDDAAMDDAAIDDAAIDDAAIDDATEEPLDQPEPPDLPGDSPSDRDREQSREADPSEERQTNPFERDREDQDRSPTPPRRDDAKDKDASDDESDSDLPELGDRSKPKISCDEIRERLRERTIDKISLDISNPFRPDLLDEEEYKKAFELFLKEQKVRDWRDVDGRMVARGRLRDLAFERVVIEQEDGTLAKFLMSELSEPDMAFLSQSWGLPQLCRVSPDPYDSRTWQPMTMAWKASGLCHHPLYFEDVELERYGHSRGPFAQPLYSTAHFFANIAILPYKMGIHPPGECQYTLGYYRPGNCAPWIKPAIPLSWRGALAEAVFIGGGIALIP
jgi:hypothetical protein